MFSAVQLMFRGLCGLSLISNTAAIDSRRFIQHATIGRQRNTKTSTFIVHTQIKLVFFFKNFIDKTISYILAIGWFNSIGNKDDLSTGW